MMGLTDAATPAPLRLGALPGISQGNATAASSSATEKQEAAESALSTVKEVASQSRRNTAAKDAAMQKLSQLKTQLNHLMMFGGDSKTRAREAAQIAKQIGEAARQYAEAGGDSAEAAAAAPSSASAQNVANATADSSTTGSTPSAPAVEWRTGTPLPVATVVTAKATPGVTTAKAPAAAGHFFTTSSKTADQAFMSEARLLARRANAILESALEEDRKTKDAGETEGHKALNAVDNAAFALGLGGSHGTEPSVGYKASAQSVIATSAPTVALTA